MEIKFMENKSIALDNNEKIGECTFITLGDTWNIIHTEVNSLYKGQGIAKKLVECVIKEAKEANIKLIADCSYAKNILENS